MATLKPDVPDDHSYTDDADRIGDDRIGDDDRVGDDYDDEYRGPTDAADDDTVGHREYVESVYGKDDDAVDRDGEHRTDEYDAGYAAPDDEGSWADEGLVGLLLVAGVVLFLFPEPATSAVGIALIALGVVAWAAAAMA